jgi:hypothetical protein
VSRFTGRPLPLARRPIHLDLALALTDGCAAGEVAFLAVADHRRAADAPKRTQRGQEIDCFQDVGLALGVVTEKQVETGRKIRVQPRVVAEVAEAQVGQVHGGRMNGDAQAGQIFWRVRAKR